MAQGGPLFFDSLCLLMCKGYYSALKAVLLGRNLAPTLRHCVIDILYSLHELNCVEWLIWSSLVAQTVKRLPAMQETWVQFLGQEDPLEKEIATHSSILAWSKYLMDRGAWQAIVHGVARVGHDLVTKSPLY